MHLPAMLSVGRTHAAELLGTDAGNAADKFTPLVRANSRRSELEFVLPANRDVTIEATDDLGSSIWETVEGLHFDRYSPTLQVIRFREPLSHRRFYRIQVREP